MHVSKNQLGCVQYPSETVPSRWRMSAHFDLLPLLKANARDLQTLRTGLLLSHAAFSMLVQKDYADPSTYVEPSSRRVTYIRLTRKTVQDIVVLNNLEKRNVVESQFSAMMKFMMSKSTPAFLGLAKELDALLEAKLAEWRGRQLNVKLDMKSGEEKDASDDVDDNDGDDGDDDAAIAHAIDTEESGFYDADESTLRTKPFGLTQHQATIAQVSTNHGAGAQGKPGAGAGDEPAPTAVEELGNGETPEQHDPLHDSSLTPEHNGTLHESSLTRSSTSSLVHTGARESVRGELQFPGHASLNSYQPSELDLMLYSFDDDDPDFNFDVSTNLNEELLIPRLELENPPLVSQIMRTVADKELNPQPQVDPPSVARGSVSSLSASSLTTRAVSDIVRVMIESQFPSRPVPTVASMSTADIASFMTSGVRAQRNLQQSRTRVLEPVLRGPKAKRKTNSMNALRELAESDDEIGRKVELRTLPQSIGQGQTKKMKTTKVTGDRLGIVDETCDFPYQVREFTTALAHTTSIKDIPEKMEALPVRLTERHLSLKTPVVSTGTTTRVLNYSIPSDMLMKMCLAVKARRTSDEVVRSAQARGLSRERGVDVDLTESEVTSHGYIVSIASSLKGFSEAQISDLNAFALLRVKCASYMHDMYWLQKEFKESMGFRIPYLLRTLAERADIEEDPDLKARFKSDINFGAREQARQVLETCTLSTSFHIASPHRHLQSTISIREIVGYLCRDAKLNDSTLTYAIRQMATDYEDVHVFDCQFTNECIPKTNLAGFRWVFFPVNIAEKHWCLLSVEVEPSSIRRVVLYDPLQDAGFEDLTQRKWHEKCEAMMLRWVERDQSEVYDVRALSKPECLRIAPQDDGTSCGVFCAAMAQELMSHSTFFQDIGEISKTAIVQTRVCICWRILCGSVRQDHRELEESAQEVCARVTSGGPYASKKTGYTILSKKKTKATTRA